MNNLYIPYNWKTAEKHIGECFCQVYDPTGNNPPDGLTLCGKYDFFEHEDGTIDYTPHERNDKYFLDHCYFDNTGIDPTLADEAVSVIWGAKARIQNCYFKNWGKALLIGNRDEPLDIAKDIYVEIENCVFDGCSRRNPYIQGASVHMKNCIIKNWGRTFFDKSFGIRVDREGSLTLENCIFIQDKFIQTNWKNFFKDCYNQVMNIKQIFNIFKPGCTRGLFTENGGIIKNMSGIYTNKWWISIEDEYRDIIPLSTYEAKMLMNSILDKVPTSKEDAISYAKQYA